jgi:hypothetical protein
MSAARVAAMSNRIACLLTVSALALVAAPALAQQASAGQATKIGGSTAVAPVIVQGAAPPKTVQKQTFDFVQKNAATNNPEIEQIGRWKDPVCVQVLGLPEDQNALIKARIQNVATSLGLPPVQEGCTADVEILFTDQPQAIMDAVAKHREQLLGYYHRHDGVRLKKVNHPVQAWYVTATRGESAYPVDPAKPLEVVDDPDNHAPIGCGINHNFTACLQSVMKNVLVVADRKALQGKDAGMLADYLVMLTLAQPKTLDGCNALPSVVDTLAASACAGREAPDGLTASDAAYLTALYQTDPEGKKMSAESDIANRMAKILIKANASGG